MADPDFVPPLHKNKGDLLYDVNKNRRRRGVKNQLEKLKQKSDSSGSEGSAIDDESIANEAPVSDEQNHGGGAAGGEVIITIITLPTPRIALSVRSSVTKFTEV